MNITIKNITQEQLDKLIKEAAAAKVLRKELGLGLTVLKEVMIY